MVIFILLIIVAIVAITIWVKKSSERRKMEGLEEAILRAHKTGRLEIIRNYCDVEGISDSIMHATRVRVIRQLADEGDLSAMKEMVLLADAPLERQNWHKKCAEAGDSESMYSVAISYMDCSANKDAGTEIDDQKAFYWFERAANNGYEKAKERVVSSYYHGSGVAEDRDKAFAMAKNYSDCGNSECGLFLALYYYANTSDKWYDINKAIKVLERIMLRGEEQYFAEAAAQLGYIYGGAYLFHTPENEYSDRRRATYCFVLAYIIKETQLYAENANEVGYNFTEFEYKKWFEDAKAFRYNPM